MVKAGYKQTEVGVIPEDWVTNRLGSLGKFTNGINKGSEDFGYGSPFVNLMDVFGVISISETKHLGLVNSSTAEQKTYDLRIGDVLFIRSSVKPEGVGLTTVVLKDLPGVVYSGFIIRFRDDGKLATEYKKHCFSEEGFRARVIANSTVSANTNINQDSLKKLVLAYPPILKEQQAIAAALSDVDALIAGLDKLIAKKRAIKTGTMQVLLTGEKRLPGFGNGRWEIKQLGEISEIISGGTPSTFDPLCWGGNIPWCTPTDITSSRGKYLTSTTRQITEAGLRATTLLPKGALLLCTRATIGEVKIATSPITTNQGFKSLVCKPGTNNEFIYYLLLTLKPKLIERGVGSTFLEVSKKAIAILEIQLPMEDEQIAIATILSDMDTEITALETRRAKTQAIKQGMMQELLTGRTRLL